ncbi:uncharacterized protein LOC113313457 isoform X5 [Papaver somniferum]|uniref:uncharacterized protein LOC113313457 isoform X5 n=1 Tax=Papaver somniferum TaxID=3469 RepID=UPI000E6FDFE7|nr:uncharacterized protein LOC113313457 isoform X5 [Papaver somniferum]
MVYFLVLGRVNLIMYCRIGDTKWTTLEIPKGIVAGKDMASLIYFKGKLYVMCCNDHFQLVVERLPLRCCNCDCISLGIRRFEVSTDSFVFPYRGGYSCVGKTYFLESDEEIYMIEMVCLDKSRHLNYLVVSINVSRLDFSSMSWKEVNTLGDTVLFLGEDTNAFCSAAELGLSKGYLYYTLHKDQSLYMFDIEDKCTMTILPCSKLPTSWFSSQWIMMPQPTVSVSVDGRIMEDLSRKVRQEDYTIRAEEIKEIISQDDNENLRKKQKKENPDEPRPWMVINEDIVDSIASHLHPVDFLHFRAVCKANKLPIVKQISGAMRSTYLTPWLLFSTENASRYNFVDPMHNNEKYLMNLPELLAGAIVRCQRGGWLLMLKDSNGTLGVFNEDSWEVLKRPHGYSNAAYVSFLVECENEVLLLLPRKVAWRTKSISRDCMTNGFCTTRLRQVVIIQLEVRIVPRIILIRRVGQTVLGLNLIGHGPHLKSSSGLTINIDKIFSGLQDDFAVCMYIHGLCFFVSLSGGSIEILQFLYVHIHVCIYAAGIWSFLGIMNAWAGHVFAFSFFFFREIQGHHLKERFAGSESWIPHIQTIAEAVERWYFNRKAI